MDEDRRVVDPDEAPAAAGAKDMEIRGRRAPHSLKRGVVAADFEIHRDDEGFWFWTFQTGNNETIARSVERYPHRTDCIHAIGLVRALSPKCRIFDMSVHGAATVVQP